MATFAAFSVFLNNLNLSRALSLIAVCELVTWSPEPEQPVIAERSQSCGCETRAFDGLRVIT